MADLKCKFCGDNLPKVLENGKRRHGNQKYHKLCYELEKQNRQISERHRHNRQHLRAPICLCVVEPTKSWAFWVQL